MAAIVQSAALSRRACQQGGVIAALLVAALASGCATSQEFFAKGKGLDEPGIGQIVCAWENAVRFAPDPARQGEPNAGLVGRVYLFDTQLSHLLEGEGELAVFLYEETEGPPVMLEAWVFHPNDLKRLMRKDRYGPGYTVFLPWGKYRPDISKIRLRTCYKPRQGAPHYTENAVTLAPGNGALQHSGSGPLTLTGGKKK